MSDNYLALVDPMATSQDAAERAGRVRDLLVAEGIILPETSPDCVLGGTGYRPGPRLREIYEPRPGECYPGEGHATCGVEIPTGRWVNEFGFTVFDWAKCPACDAMFEDEILGDMADAMETFTTSEEPPMVACPSCSVSSRAQAWMTQPHLGFCHLVVLFWNWPSFGSFGWRESIPWMVRRALGSSVVTSYGHL